MIKSYKQAICNHCECGIDLYPYPISTKRFNEILIESGVVVKGSKHFCDQDCYSRYIEEVKE